MSDSEVRIRPVANGYIISFRDPKVVAKNKANQAKKDVPYEYLSATKEIACKSLGEVTAFLESTLSTILPEVDFDTAYAKALKESDD